MDFVSLEKIQSQLKNKKTQIVAVSKKQSVEKIRDLYKQGQRIFAENYVQEALEKQKQLKDLKDIRWHFIGHLQTNKIKNVVGEFELIHSVDSLKVLEVMQKIAKEKNIVQKVLLQVNFSMESTKEGFLTSEILPLLPKIQDYSHLQVLGFMTMPPLVNKAEENRIYFQQAKDFLMQTPWSDLSMGTSHDYLVAAEEGATYIRLGTVLFGERS